MPIKNPPSSSSSNPNAISGFSDSDNGDNYFAVERNDLNAGNASFLFRSENVFDAFELLSISMNAEEGFVAIHDTYRIDVHAGNGVLINQKFKFYAEDGQDIFQLWDNDEDYPGTIISCWNNRVRFLNRNGVGSNYDSIEVRDIYGTNISGSSYFQIESGGDASDTYGRFLFRSASADESFPIISVICNAEEGFIVNYGEGTVNFSIYDNRIELIVNGLGVVLTDDTTTINDKVRITSAGGSGFQSLQFWDNIQDDWGASLSCQNDIIVFAGLNYEFAKIQIDSLIAKAILIEEETNGTMGLATLSSGSVVVSTTAVKADSRIMLTVQGGTLTNVGAPYVFTRTVDETFTIKSTNPLDTCNVAWLIIQPS